MWALRLVQCLLARFKLFDLTRLAMDVLLQNQLSVTQLLQRAPVGAQLRQIVILHFGILSNVSVDVAIPRVTLKMYQLQAAMIRVRLAASLQAQVM